MPDSLREVVEEYQRTDRHRANLFYAGLARGAVKGISEDIRIPEDPVRAARLRAGMDWILARSTVLSELGRLMVDDPSEQDIRLFQGVLMYIAERLPKITAKEAVAYVRRMRLGETERRDRLEALHHDLNAAINYHRRRFPESSWTDVLKALELTEGQIRKKVR